MATAAMKIDPTGTVSMADIIKILGTVLPQNSTETAASTPSAEAMANSNAILNTVRPSITDQQSALVDNILQRSAQAFLPTRGEEHVAGGYDSSTIKLLSDNARAKAVAESVDAVLKNQQAAGATAAGITNQQLAATRSTTTNKTQAPLVSASMLSSLVGAGLLANKVFGAGKKGKLPPITAGETANEAGAAAGDAAENVTYGDLTSGTSTAGEDAAINQSLGITDFVGPSENVALNLGAESFADAFAYGGDFAGDAAIGGFENFAGDAAGDFAGELAGDAATSFGFPYLTAARLAGKTLGINEITEPLDLVSQASSDLIGGVGDFIGGFFDDFF